MAKKKTQVNNNSIQVLLSLYRQTISTNPNSYAQAFAACKTDADKAKMLLVGNHQWFLSYYRKNVCQAILGDMARNKPWQNQLSSFNGFEQVYNWVRSWLCHYSYIKQLTVYDVALRLIYIHNLPHLLPQNKVYIHATPLLAYKWLYAINVFNIPVRNDKPLDFSLISQQVSPLTASEAEDFLCYVGKAVDKLSKKSKSRKSLGKITVANVLSQLQSKSPRKSASNNNSTQCKP